jgi:GTP cyclohydrolase I
MGKPDRRAAALAIEAFLRALGHDPAEEPELALTGERVAAAYLDELCDGYDVDVGELLRAESIVGATHAVALHDIAVTTVCPHHLLPAAGKASVAFGPGVGEAGRLVGLGTLAKLVDAYAHRLALQEEIGQQVALALSTHLSARWAACRLVMEHACVSARGVRRHGTLAETFAFVGDPAERPTALDLLRVQYRAPAEGART